jgi:hypothetical protein
VREEEWRAKAGPWARAILPDGQELDVVVTERTRTQDGVWWYECEAILPARYEHADGRTRTTGAPTPISVLDAHIRPIPGEDYGSVPTRGAISGRQWLLQNLHQYLPDSPSRRLHRRDCWQARGEHTLITTAEAAALTDDPAVSMCDVCSPQKALRGPGPDPTPDPDRSRGGG